MLHGSFLGEGKPIMLFPREHTRSFRVTALLTALCMYVCGAIIPWTYGERCCATPPICLRRRFLLLLSSYQHRRREKNVKTQSRELEVTSRGDILPPHGGYNSRIGSNVPTELHACVASRAKIPMTGRKKAEAKACRRRQM